MIAKPKVNIVGAGIGGITTAIFLAQKGFDVNVFEKNALPGGRCGQTIREGHRFDLGATIYFLPSIYEQVFQKMGLNIKECFDFIPMENLYRISYDDNSSLNFTHNREALEKQLESREKGSFKAAMRYTKKGYSFLNIGLGELLDRNFYHPFQFITIKNLVQILRIKGHLKHGNYIKRFFKHPHHRMAFTFQNIYVGQSPFQASALFSMLPAAELTEGSMFPRGGMHAIVQKMVGIAEELGVNFSYGNPVEEIIIEKKKAVGLRFENGLIEQADWIVANADLPYVYSSLLPKSLRAKWINRHEFTSSALVLHWGTKKRYPQLAHHNVYLVDDFKGALDTIFKDGELGDKPCFYIHAPVATDPDAAPQGEDTLSIVVPVPNLKDSKIKDWQAVRKQVKLAVLTRLKQDGITDLEENIKFEIAYLPDTWKKAVNVSHGATFGSLSHKIFQMGYFRPHNQHGKYKNLFFVGGSTHPGNGVPLILLSGKLTAERIHKTHSKH